MKLSEFADIANQVKFSISYKLREYIYNNIRKKALLKIGEFDVQYATTKEPVPFDKRNELEYKTIKPGELWSLDSYECGWFKLTVQIPKEYEGTKIAAIVNIDGEGLFVDESGSAIQGISTLMSVIEYTQPFKGKSFFEITKDAKEGKIELWIEAGNNRKDTQRHRKARFKYANLVVVNDELIQLYYDLLILDMQRCVIKNKDKKRAIVVSMREAVKTIAEPTKENIEKAREILKAEIESGEDFPFTLYAVGHAHLDLAWLWPIRETRRKAIRTLANQIKNIENNPGYIFGLSQPQQLEWLEEDDPKLFKQVAKHIKEGNIEAQGAMWVETDVNLPSGESLVRQIMYGQRYWEKNFGFKSQMCWLPDVFGYNGNLPQILKKSGLPYFSTQKMSWNEQNKFPHRSFNWVGIDGSSVITHMPPDNSYVSEATPFSTMHAYNHFPEKDKFDKALLVYGIGDGGGGPSDGHIAMAKRHKNIRHLPKVEMRPAIDIFPVLEKQKNDLVEHHGELYLEKHQGTYTSQALIKKNNRKIEFKLQNVEFLCSLAMRKGMKYPHAKLDEIWKEVLLYQFHDIIPGSSIKRVYDECYARYEVLFEDLKKIENEAISYLKDKKSTGLHVINPTAYRVKDSLTYEGKEYEVEVEPFSSADIREIKEDGDFNFSDFMMESSKYILEFDGRGNITRLHDKFSKQEFVRAGHRLNILNLYNDPKLYYNAWDIDINYTKKFSLEANLVGFKHEKTKDKIIRTNEYKVGKSQIWQKIVLSKNSPLIDFQTEVDWQETHKMLRAEFRPQIETDEILCDIQFGSLKRTMKNETSVEKAQFEICAHKWVDISQEGKGLSFLTESKYGWRAKEGFISLNLLRSPMYPAKDCDKGTQKFSYALYPHGGDHNAANTQKWATIYNNPLIVTKGKVEIDSIILKDNDHIVIETIKKAEDKNGLIIRTFEDSGKDQLVNFKLKGFNKVYEVNLVEDVIGEVDLNSLNYKPYEIRSFLLLEE